MPQQNQLTQSAISHLSQEWGRDYKKLESTLKDFIELATRNRPLLEVVGFEGDTITIKSRTISAAMNIAYKKLYAEIKLVHKVDVVVAHIDLMHQSRDENVLHRTPMALADFYENSVNYSILLRRVF